jgi:hypothetical protein
MALQRINTGYGALRLDGNLTVVSTTANVYLGNVTYPLGSIFASNVNTSGNITASGNIASTSTAYTQIAAGNTAQRPAGGVLGMIRYNSSISSYEGFGAGSAWSSLGGVKSVDGFAFISAEASAGAGDDVLRFYSGSTGSSVQVMWASGGNISVLPTTVATSTTTGALQVAGGASVAGNLYIGGSAGNAIVATGNITVTGNILPTANVTYDLGTSELRWRDLFLSGTTINLGGTTISAPAGGALAVSTGNIVAASSQASTSTTTGALVVRGGAGIAGAVNAGSTVIASGNIVAASGTASTNATTGALVVAGGAGISGNVFTGGWIIPTSNVSQNLGSTTSWWNIFYGKSTQAQYADLAENYLADRPYPAGTVVEFGGDKEVTISAPETIRVAGVVSSNPAHLMNGALQGPNVVPVALQGRVPCQVVGPVAKGDLMVSAGFGFAKTNNHPQPGQVIGKALEAVTGQNKAIIEVVVGRV